MLPLCGAQVLVTWLNHAPNYEEVTKWYLGWKQLIPEKLVGHAVVRGELHATTGGRSCFVRCSRVWWFLFIQKVVTEFYGADQLLV